MNLLPKWGGYDILEETKELEGGARYTKLVRRYHKTKIGDGESEDAPLLGDR